MSSFFQDIISLGFLFAMKKKIMKVPRIEMEGGIAGAGHTFNHKCPN